MRIAILEDDPDQLALLKRWVAADGHDVHGWLSGREAMRQAGGACPIESYDRRPEVVFIVGSLKGIPMRSSLLAVLGPHQA